MMKTAMAAFTTAAVLLVGGQGNEKELARFAGTWKITKFVSPKGDLDPGVASVTFTKDGKLTFTKDDKTKKASFKVNAAAKPKEIDMTHPEDDGKKLLGIYQFDKKTLKLCFNLDGAQRPTEFTAPEGGSNMVIVMERMKK